MSKIYLKSYCYSDHELPFVIGQLQEGYEHIDKLILYEYNYTHTGIKKEYKIEKVLNYIPENLRDKLDYKKIDLTNYHVVSPDNEDLCHRINEPIQRNWFFNDNDLDLKDNDVIIDIDIDEIIYKNSYSLLLDELKRKKRPLSIKLNQFFFKNNYLWANCNFSSPTIYQYKMVKNNSKKIKGLIIKNLRDLSRKTEHTYGCHMSWVMPIEYMIKKINSGAHIRYKHLADKEKLQKAVDEKKYIFDLNRPFNIVEIELEDTRIPQYLQREDIFDYELEDKGKIEIPT